MVRTYSKRKGNYMKNIFSKLLISFLFFFILTNTCNSENEDNIYKKIDLFSEVLDKINKEYVEDVNQSDAMDAAINGVLQSLDPYSAYMSPELYESMQTETSGEFGGLGIEVGMEAGVVKVISPIDNSPASRVGIKAGDYIVKINDIQVQGKSLSEAVDIMRGPVGSNIEITVRRRGEKKALIFTITREIIKVASVKSRIINEKTGYLRLTSFNENSGDQIKEKIKEFKKNIKVENYILDLRNNPGGLLSQAIKISNFFLDNGEIVSTKSKRKHENRKWFAKKGDILKDETMIVLINYGTMFIPYTFDRTSLAGTTLIALVAFNLVTSTAKIPVLPYLNLFDWFMFMAYFNAILVIGSTIFESIYIGNFMKETPQSILTATGDNKIKLDRIRMTLRISVPVIFIISPDARPLL